MGVDSDHHLRAYAGAVFAVSVWGASFVATKIGVREVHPLTVMWLRFGNSMAAGLGGAVIVAGVRLATRG